LASLTIESSGPDWQIRAVSILAKSEDQGQLTFCQLKTEANWGLNHAIERGWAAAPTAAEAAKIARATGRNPEIRGAEIPDRTEEIHVIQHILEVHAEGQVVAFGFAAAQTAAAKTTATAATARATTAAAAASREAAAATTGEATSTTGAAGATLTIIATLALTVLLAATVLRGAAFGSETDRLADAQVGDYRSRSMAIVAWNDRRTGKWICVEVAEPGEDDARPGQVAGDRRTIGKQ